MQVQNETAKKSANSFPFQLVIAALALLAILYAMTVSRQEEQQGSFAYDRPPLATPLDR